MKWLLTIPTRAPRATLAVMLAVTLFFAWFAPRVEVDNSLQTLLPAGSADLAYYEAAREVFGSDEFLLVGVFADDVFAPSTLAKIKRISDELSELDGIAEVLSLSTIKGVEMGDFGLETGPLMSELPETPEAAQAFRERIYANPIYAQNVVSEKGDAASISVLIETMSDREFTSRGIEEQVRALLDKYAEPEQFALTGSPSIKSHGGLMLQQDRRRFTPLAVVVIFLVLVWTFHTVRGVVLALVPALVAVIWTNGVMELLGAAIDMGTVILNPLIIAIGTAYAIHLLSEYYAQAAKGASRTDVVLATVHHVQIPTAVAGITTLLGFAVLSWNPIPATRNLGIYAMFGIAVTLHTTLTVLPALLMLLPLPKARRQEAADGGWLDRALVRVGTLPLDHPRAVLGIAALCVVWSVWGIGAIRVVTDFLGFFSPTSEVRREYDLVTEKLAGTLPFFVIIDGDKPQAVTRFEAFNAIRDLQEFIERQPGVDTTLSVVDYLEIVRGALKPDVGPSPPDTQTEIDQMLLLVNPSDTRRMVSRDFSRANIAVRTRIRGSAAVDDFVDNVRKFSEEHLPGKLRARVTGSEVLLNQSADTVATSQVVGIAQMIGLVFVVMCLLFLSVRVGLLSLVPNVLPVVMLFGLMGWSGISLNISTGMIAAIALGIAVDDTIHYLNRFNEEMRKTGSQRQAAINVMHTIGKPIVVTSVSLASGFLVVCLSNFDPVKHFGYLASATMVLALLADLLITPAVATTTKIITLWDLLFVKVGPDPHKQIPLFEGLGSLQAKIVVLMGRLASAPRGAFIVRQGESKAEFYVVLTGHAEVRRAGHTGAIKTLNRGDVVGEMGAVRQALRSADVVATEDLEYLVLDRNVLNRLRFRYPRIGCTLLLNLTRVLSDRLQGTTDVLTGTSVSKTAVPSGTPAGPG